MDDDRNEEFGIDSSEPPSVRDTLISGLLELCRGAFMKNSRPFMRGMGSALVIVPGEIERVQRTAYVYAARFSVAKAWEEVGGLLEEATCNVTGQKSKSTSSAAAIAKRRSAIAYYVAVRDRATRCLAISSSADGDEKSAVSGKSTEQICWPVTGAETSRNRR